MTQCGCVPHLRGRQALAFAKQLQLEGRPKGTHPKRDGDPKTPQSVA